MGYRPLEEIASWLRLALLACAAFYVVAATETPESPTFDIVRETDHDAEITVVLVVATLSVLFFERAYRNLAPLGLQARVPWRSTLRPSVRWLTAGWISLSLLAAVSIAAGNQLHAGRLDSDEAPLSDFVETAGEIITVVAALVAAGVITAISLRQSRRAAELAETL